MKLNYCEKCGQMTNHDTHACLKCAIPHTDQFEEIAIDDVIHDLEALDFNSQEARDVVRKALHYIRQEAEKEMMEKAVAEINKIGIGNCGDGASWSQDENYAFGYYKGLHDAREVLSPLEPAALPNPELR